MRLVNITGCVICISFLVCLTFSSASLSAARKLDYDNDGRSDVILRRPLEFNQLIQRSSDTANQSVVFGRNARDIPVYGYFDGDGITDIGVRRPSNQTWYIQNSSGTDNISNKDDGISRLKFGSQAGDIQCLLITMAMVSPILRCGVRQRSSGIFAILLA